MERRNKIKTNEIGSQNKNIHQQLSALFKPN